MATVKKAVTAQTVLAVDFTFNVALDAMRNTSGVLTNFKATAGVFDIATLPPNHQVVGGDIAVTEVSNDTGTATLSIGDDGSATRYASAVNLKSAARTALTITGFKSTISRPLRATIANNTGDATTGIARVVAQFIVVDGRTSENLKTT
jgi:hypothetical protein